MRWRPAFASVTTRSSTSTTSTAPPRPTSEVPEPPRGVDAGAFYNLIDIRHGEFDATLLSIDRASNNTSIVLLLEWQGWRLLFTGDAETAQLADDGQSTGMVGPVHFLKVSHHGSATPGCRRARSSTSCCRRRRHPPSAAAGRSRPTRTRTPASPTRTPSTSSASGSTCARRGTSPPASCSSNSGSRRRDPDRSVGSRRGGQSTRAHPGPVAGREAASTLARACSGAGGRRDRGGDAPVGEAPAQEGVGPAARPAAVNSDGNGRRRSEPSPNGRIAGRRAQDPRRAAGSAPRLRVARVERDLDRVDPTGPHTPRARRTPPTRRASRRAIECPAATFALHPVEMPPPRDQVVDLEQVDPAAEPAELAREVAAALLDGLVQTLVATNASRRARRAHATGPPRRARTSESCRRAVRRPRTRWRRPRRPRPARRREVEDTPRPEPDDWELDAGPAEGSMVHADTVAGGRRLAQAGAGLR